ncbi:MAG: winged helix-turn-helix transcriptional regulator [Candidatus Saliniplasma sp.]
MNKKDLDESSLELAKIIDKNPRISKSELMKKVDMDQDEFEEKLRELTDSGLVIRLTTTANSSMESRVPKKVFMLNPEKKSELQG